MASFAAEASTATVTRRCLHKFQQCIQQLQAKDKIHIQTRLADLRLWSDSVGAAASAKASLDSRFQHRSKDIYLIQQLLSMLEGFLQECLTAASDGSDIQDTFINIDSTVDSLALVGVQIRRSGRKSRLRKADGSFDENRDRYRKLRAHLACILTAKPTKEGRPDNEGKEINSVDYFADMELPSIQERLAEANLRRRHRFVEAQNHSHGMKDPSTKASYTVIPQQFITMAATDTKRRISPMQDIKVATALRQKQVRPPDAGQNAPTIPTTSASGIDSKWGGLQKNRRAGSRISAITAAEVYPRPHPPSSEDQKLVKCPCCCQAIPASELEDSQWRKHVANDLCPYTCIVEDCPTPYTLFVTQKEWSEHVMNDHPPHWQCPCCEGDSPTFKSLSKMTIHIGAQHPEALSDGLENLLSIAEINIMGITKCPLCDSEGPQDSPKIIEHVSKHIHNFSLRSLPWPMDPIFSLERHVGLFDMNHAFKGEEDVFRIDHWAETVAPGFDLEKGVKTVIDDKGEKVLFGIAGWPEDRTLKDDHSLQLCDVDHNPPKPSEEELAAIAKSETDYFAQNDYFKDVSSDGRFSSQTFDSSQTQNSIKHSMQQWPKKWVCTLCGVQSIEGDDAYYQHLEHFHTAYIEENATDVELWKGSMLDEAYWNGVDGAISTPFIEHPDTWMTTLASRYHNVVRVEEVQKLMMQMMEKRMRMLGPEHSDTLLSMTNLVPIYRHQKRWKEAETLDLHVMETIEKTLGPTSTPVEPPVPTTKPEMPETPFLSFNDAKKIRVEDGLFLPEHQNLLNNLKNRDHMFLIDDSLSMEPYWIEVISLFSVLAWIVKKFDDDGFEMCFTISAIQKHFADTSKAVAVLGKIKLYTYSNIDSRLLEILEEYQKHLESRKTYFRRKAKLNPLSLYVFTDAAWPNSDAVGPVEAMIAKLHQLGFGKEQVGIQFIRFGNHTSGMEKLKYIESGLRKKYSNHWDIVDTEPFQGGNIFKMLLGAIFNKSHHDENNDEDDAAKD